MHQDALLPIVETKDLCKRFGPTVALDHVNIRIMPGKITGLIGENGSGKSTISSIIAGMQPATSGELFLHGKPYKPASMIDGAAHGMGMIVQESGTVSGLTLAQNIFLGSEKQFTRFGLVDRKAMNAAAQEALDAIGFTRAKADDPIDMLDQQERKLVEVAKVMYRKPEVMIVDETTTALSQSGRDIVYKLMAQQRDEGKAVIFISHDLDEVMEHCDCLSVLRDGVLIGTLERNEFDPALVKKYMVGREIGEKYYREDYGRPISDEVVLEARDLTSGLGIMTNVSLKLHRGEILGVAGLSDCGMHELGHALFGEGRTATGTVTVYPSGAVIDSPVKAMANGIGYVSKDRDREALVLTASIRDNIVAAGFDKVAGKAGLITRKAEKAYVDKQVAGLSIKCAEIDQNVQYLSGGNKQKVVFGKWVGRDSSILILDCPTRGVDIGVKTAMYQLMDDMAKEGRSILMISEEMTELIGMCDRILVMKNGRLNGEFLRSKDVTENHILDCMIQGGGTMKTKKINTQKLLSFAPYVGLALVIAFYLWTMASEGITVDYIRIRSILGNIITTALVSIGAVYAFSCGAIDMSMSGSVCLSAIVGALVCKASGSVLLAFGACMVVALVLGLMKGLLAIFMHVPAFIVTIVGGTVFSALGAVLMGKETTLSLSDYFNTTADQTVIIGVILLVVFYIVALVLFNYTSFGKSAKLMGGNPRSAAQSGIKANSIMLKAFLIGGISIGLAAVFMMLQTKTVTQASGGSLGNDMMVAVVLGGMPISGGSKSKISAAVVGASTITVLNTALTVLGLTVGYIQIVRGILFLTVVFVTSMTYRGKLLPR